VTKTGNPNKLRVRKYFESKLPGIRWKGDQGTAKCRFHSDRHPSLSVNAEKGIFCCHACDAKGDLVKFERLISRCDLKTAQRRIAKLANRGGGSNLRSRIITVYPYEDAKGRQRYQQVRLEPKGFRFRRPAENGEWIWNLNGVVKILYRLPEVLAAEEVYIAEGEKDVETLRSCGLVATCNPGGAGKWRDEYSQVLKNKKIIILQDDDEPGRKHAQAVADSLSHYAADVRIIPPFPNAKDVTQWVEQGGTKRRLEKLVAGTSPIELVDASIDTAVAQQLSADDWRAKPLRGVWTVRLPENLFKDYLVLPPGIAFVASLWVIGTYIFEDFDCFAYLTITSPTKRCGKTRFGEILELVSCRALMSVNLSEAALFRLIDSQKPSLIIDEAEALSSRDSDRAKYLLSILHAGFKQGASVPRCVGRDFKVQNFSVYCPKAILAIGNLPDTLTDRSIVVSMRRHLPNEQVARFRRRSASQQAAGIVNVIKAWVDEHKKQIVKTYFKQNLDFLRDREADIWEPLFAIATVAVPERIEELKQTAIRLSGEKASMDVDDSQGLRLLADIRTIFSTTSRSSMPSAELVGRLKKDAATNWGDDFTQSRLARLLRPFGISPQQIWWDERNFRGYRRGDFKSAFDRYLTPESL
jgi:hypothetical protein